MDQTPTEQRPQLFGPDGPPSSAGLAAGSGGLDPGGGLSAARGNPAANTSPHHTTQGSGSQAEISAVNPQASDPNPTQTPISMAAGNAGVSMAADTNNTVGSDGHATNRDKEEHELLSKLDLAINVLSSKEDGPFLLLQLLFQTIRTRQANHDLQHFFLSPQYDEHIAECYDRLRTDKVPVDILDDALRLARHFCTPQTYDPFIQTGQAARNRSVAADYGSPGAGNVMAAQAMMATPRPPTATAPPSMPRGPV